MDEDPLLNRDYLRIALTPDGSVLVTSNLNREGPVRFWDVSNGKLVSGKKAQKRYAGALPTHKQWPMVLGPHFKALHGSSGSERLVIQAAASGQPITELLHEGRVNDAALSPDGRYVATASADGAARLFLLRTDDLINEACRRVVTNLTEDQWNRHVSLGRPRKTCLSVPD
jgi:WD40 repeat protein